MDHKRLTEYIEGLTVTQGPDRGSGLALYPWQRRFLKRFCATEGEVSLSVARGAGKTTFIASIASAFIDPDGPLHEPRADVVCVAPSLMQGGVIYEHVLAFLSDKIGANEDDFRVLNSTNRLMLQYTPTGARLFVVGSDPRRLHGLAPKYVIGDELAQWPENQIARMISALRTATGKIEGARCVWIGTRADSPDHPFEQMLDGRDGNVTFAVSYSARKNDPPFQRRTWKRANPGLDRQPELEKVIRREAAAARDNDELLPSFRALRLNQGVPDFNGPPGIITPDLYRELEVKETPVSGAYVMGLDLGVSWSMSAVSAVSLDRHEGRYVVDGLAAWPGVRGRRKGDGSAPYQTMIARGELILQEGRRTVDIASLLDTAFDRWGVPYCIVADRFRDRELQDALNPLGFYEGEGLILRGMGYKDGSEDVRAFQRAVQDRALAFNENILLRSSFASVRLMIDPAGNRKIAKANDRSNSGRDDCAVATVLAVAETMRLAEQGSAQDEPVMVFDATTDGWNW